MIELTHLFKRRCSDPMGLLNNCFKLNTFVSRLEKQAKLYAMGDIDRENEYKGWGLEIFTEYLCKVYAMDKRVGISNYQPVSEDDDTGVDGFGTGINGKPATVQVKFRQADWVLTANADHLTNFTWSSVKKYGVDVRDDDKNMLIVTTGKDINWATDQKMLMQTVRILHREKLRVLVDNNKVFWKTFLDSWLASTKTP